jgi:hypothetical protein
VVVTAAAKCLVVHGREQAFRQPEQKERRRGETPEVEYVAEELLFARQLPEFPNVLYLLAP